jgi:hypothetical protein
MPVYADDGICRTVSETPQNLRWSEQVSRRSKSRPSAILVPKFGEQAAEQRAGRKLLYRAADRLFDLRQPPVLAVEGEQLHTEKDHGVPRHGAGAEPKRRLYQGLGVGESSLQQRQGSP